MGNCRVVRVRLRLHPEIFQKALAAMLEASPSTDVCLCSALRGVLRVLLEFVSGMKILVTVLGDGVIFVLVVVIFLLLGLG